MSEEKKVIELKEEELEKVSGGVTVKKTYEYECDICHETFSDVDSLGRHKIEKHPKYGPDKHV